MYQYPILRVAHVLFWVLYAGLEHLSHIMYGENHWQGSLFASLVAMICTAALALVYERTVQKPIVLRVLALSAVGFVTIIVWHNLTRLLHYHISLEALINAPFIDWLAGSAYSVVLLVGWAGLFVSAYIYLEKKAQQEELQLIKSTARDAQLQQLLHQISPHFLFNVLNSIDVAILEKDNDTAHKMVVKLSHFLRSTLDQKFHNKITLKQELELLHHFVDIEQQRFHQHIQFKEQIQSESLKAFLPPLLLQPLVENAIKFSWQLGTDCIITLNVSINERLLNIAICNPCDATKSNAAAGTNTGLNNVRSRLALLYGENAYLRTRCVQQQFEAVLQLPLELAL